MPFAKGKPKTGGRTPGTTNRITGTMREMLEKFLIDNFANVCDEFAALEGKDKINTFVKLLEFSLPKLNRVEAEIAPVEKAEPMDLSALSEDELIQMLRLMEKAEAAALAKKALPAAR